MEILYITVGAIFVCGVGLAIYEDRKKVTLLKHDFNHIKGAPTEADHEHERTSDVFTNNIHH
jgi:hypothetical protein